MLTGHKGKKYRPHVFTSRSPNTA